MKLNIPTLDENGNLVIEISSRTFEQYSTKLGPATMLEKKLAIVANYLYVYSCKFSTSRHLVVNNAIISEYFFRSEKKETMIDIFLKQYRKQFEKVLKLVTGCREIKFIREPKIDSWNANYTYYSDGLDTNYIPIQQVVECEKNLFLFLFTSAMCNIIIY